MSFCSFKELLAWLLGNCNFIRLNNISLNSISLTVEYFVLGIHNQKKVLLKSKEGACTF